MAYCRFSSCNWTCDVYVYEACTGGITIHVAGHRRFGTTPIPELPKGWPDVPVEELSAALVAQDVWLATSQMVPIGLPHDGETISGLSALDAIETLRKLQLLGYMVPTFAIEQLIEDAADTAGS